ncbi:hypothetical protein EJB05_38713 [Eragrostis curvula]|uniref:Uncharacterized protein n=1 Tax=Eragrostis curvula TaxID=38414 RepID=A0A5J9TV09_9POAL|nr:hypothetical protein EJB05_38713 [Eragrostis curvula]
MSWPSTPSCWMALIRWRWRPTMAMAARDGTSGSAVPASDGSLQDRVRITALLKHLHSPAYIGTNFAQLPELAPPSASPRQQARLLFSKS